MTSERIVLTEDADQRSRGRFMGGLATSERITPSIAPPFGLPQVQIPRFIQAVLEDFGLLAAFLSRPQHHQDAYVSWIASADVEDTRDTRIAAMLDELAEHRDWDRAGHNARRPSSGNVIP